MRPREQKNCRHGKIRNLLLAAIVGAVSLPATDYYLDPAGGDDRASGRTPEHAWKTLARLQRFLERHTLSAGDRILLKRGETFSGDLRIDGRHAGAPGSFVVVRAYGQGAKPLIRGGIRIEGAHHLRIADLALRPGQGDGVAVVNGADGKAAHHVTVTRCRIRNAPATGIRVEGGGHHHIRLIDNDISGAYLGIYMASDAGDDYPNLDKSDDRPLGCANLIEGNRIHHNTLTGIALAALSLKEYPPRYRCDGSTPQRERNTVRANRISDNGGHGIEITSNHILVENNRVIHNGIHPLLGGFSGIHLFDRWPSESGPDSDRYERGGDDNIIRNNLCRNNRDRRNDRTDGNGIQMDMWCDRNLVYNNVATGNDGAGIIAFGARGNRIVNNTLYDNGRDIGVRYGANELVVISAEIDEPDEADAVSEAGQYLLVARDNRIVNNLALAVASDNPDHPNYEGYIDCRKGACRYALAVDDYGINRVDAVGNNVFAKNIWFNSQRRKQAVAVIKVSENEHFQIPPGSTPADVWRSEASVHGDIIRPPRLVDPAGGDLRPRSDSPAVDRGRPLSDVATDNRGKPRPRGAGWDIGAYEIIKR